MAELLTPFAGEAAAELAARLIGRFGSLSRMLRAPLPQLRAAAGGHDAAVEAIVGAVRLVEAAQREELASAPVHGADPRIHRYLRAVIGKSDRERVLAIFACRNGRFLAVETIAEGTAGGVETRLRPLFERALELGAGGVLLAHNHPSGLCRPSERDIAATNRLADIAGALDLAVIDHLIVTRTRIFSMRLGDCF